VWYVYPFPGVNPDAGVAIVPDEIAIRNGSL
jgi:hypothetical protein